MASPWTPEPKAKVARLWEKHSDSVISRILWEEDRVSFSRNAIIGLRHRMGTTGRLPPQEKEVVTPRPRRNSGPVVQKINRERRAPKPKPIFETVPLADLRVVDLAPRASGITITDLEPGECRWPVDERGGIHHFCGDPVATSIDKVGRMVTHSYCAHHRAMSIGPGTTSERTATRGIAA